MTSWFCHKLLWYCGWLPGFSVIFLGDSLRSPVWNKVIITILLATSSDTGSQGSLWLSLTARGGTGWRLSQPEKTTVWTLTLYYTLDLFQRIFLAFHHLCFFFLNSLISILFLSHESIICVWKRQHSSPSPFSVYPRLFVTVVFPLKLVFLVRTVVRGHT